MLFGKKISFYEAKDFLITQSRFLKPEVSMETETFIELCIVRNKRRVCISITNLPNGVKVDITDSYYLLHIPQETFKNITKYKAFIINSLHAISDELDSFRQLTV